MKKFTSIFTLIIILAVIFNFNIVKATDQTPTTPTVNLTYKVEQNGNQVIFSISLGNFEGIEENAVMSASASLEFDNSQIESIEGNAFNGWSVTVSADTKMALFETDTANPNTEIGEIIFNLSSDNVTETTQGTVAITELEISDGLVLDETYQGTEYNYTLEPVTEAPETPEEPEENTNTINIGGTDQSNSGTTTNTINTNSTADDTISPDTELPQTGLGITIVVGLIIIATITIVCIVKYKSIEIK